MHPLSILLFGALCGSVIGAPKVNYSVMVTGTYDNNIGLNNSMVNRFYITPAGSISWFPARGPVYLRVTSGYESYVTERLPEFNDPLFRGAIGGKLKKKRFMWDSELAGAEWFAQDVRPAGTTETPDQFLPAGRRLSLTNDFLIGRAVKGRFGLNTTFDLNDNYDNQRDGVTLSIAPEWTYLFPWSQNKRAGVRQLSVTAEYKGTFVKSASESYNLGGIGAGANFRFGKRVRFDLAAQYDRKMYSGLEAQSVTGDSIKQLQNIIGGSTKLDLQLVSDLHLVVGGKMRFRTTNQPSSESDHHTAYVRLLWSSSFGNDDEESRTKGERSE